MNETVSQDYCPLVFLSKNLPSGPVSGTLDQFGFLENFHEAMYLKGVSHEN